MFGSIRSTFILFVLGLFSENLSESIGVLFCLGRDIGDPAS